MKCGNGRVVARLRAGCYLRALDLNRLKMGKSQSSALATFTPWLQDACQLGSPAVIELGCGHLFYATEITWASARSEPNGHV